MPLDKQRGIKGKIIKRTIRRTKRKYKIARARNRKKRHKL
jgi:hypothetical protein